MRIGMLADVYKPHVSGITHYIELSKEYLEKLGHEVFVFTFGDNEFEDSEENIVRSPGLPLVDTGYYLGVRYNQAAQKLLRTMDLVHVHHPFISGRLALRYCKPRSIPVVFTNHTRYDLYAKAYIPALPDIVGESFLKTYLPDFCEAVDLVIAPSSGMKDVLHNLGVVVKIDVVPNGVDLTPFLKGKEVIDRAKLGFSSEDIILIYAGRLGPEKNLTFLLRSFNGAAQAYDNIGMVFVGDGPERDNLEDRVHLMGIEERVHFTGMVPYENIAAYLKMADVFVTASITEVHPLSVIEAMATGLPVLGIQSPGIGDSVEEGVSGLLCPEEDLAAFTAKMVRLITDGSRRCEMGNQARHLSQRYAIENTTEVMVSHYQRLERRSHAKKRSLRMRLIHMLDRWR